MSPAKILIVGGGIGGLTAALCLARQGCHVQVFEQASTFAEVGAGIQLSPNCTRVLHHLGLEAQLRPLAFLPEGTQFRHWRAGTVLSENRLGDDALTRFGMPYYHMHRADLMQVLVEAAGQQPEIELLTSTSATAFTQTNDGVQLHTGTADYAGDLLIGADGIHSIVREQLWGEEQPSFTGNVAWRALVPTHCLPADLVRPVATVWWGPGKHFVHYYVRGGDLVNCVCVVEKNGWEVESWTEPGDLAELQQDFAGWHSDVQQLIDAIPSATLFKWALFDRSPMPAWGQGRVTLLGDACHPTLPFMAQGAAMAIEDAAVLAACLRERAPVAAALQRYEQLRRARTAGIQKGSRRNARVFHLSGIKAWLRNRAARTAGNRTVERLYQYNALTAAGGNNQAGSTLESNSQEPLQR